MCNLWMPSEWPDGPPGGRFMTRRASSPGPYRSLGEQGDGHPGAKVYSSDDMLGWLTQIYAAFCMMLLRYLWCYLYSVCFDCMVLYESLHIIAMAIILFIIKRKYSLKDTLIILRNVLSTVNVEIFTQYIFSRISRRALDAQKFDVSETYYHNRTNRINWHMHKNWAVQICLLMLDAQKCSCVKICTFAVCLKDMQ